MMIVSGSLNVFIFGVTQPVVDYASGKDGSQGVHGGMRAAGTKAARWSVWLGKSSSINHSLFWNAGGLPWGSRQYHGLVAQMIASQTIIGLDGC